MPIVPDDKNWTWVLERACPQCGFDAAHFPLDQVARAVEALGGEWRDLLAHPKKILALIKSDLTELAVTYGDDRRTRIAAEAQENIHDEDLVADESVLISLTERGYIKRVPSPTPRIPSA